MFCGFLVAVVVVVVVSVFAVPVAFVIVVAVAPSRPLSSVSLPDPARLEGPRPFCESPKWPKMASTNHGGPRAIRTPTIFPSGNYALDAPWGPKDP